MRLTVCLIFILAALVGCTPAIPTDGGIEGRVTSGPSCPVSQPDIPCPDMPYAATLSILDEVTRRQVASTTADETGYYRALLPPGFYIIHPESPGVLPRASEVAVHVLPNQFTRQDIQYDTGIR